MSTNTAVVGTEHTFIVVATARGLAAGCSCGWWEGTR